MHHEITTIAIICSTAMMMSCLGVLCSKGKIAFGFLLSTSVVCGITAGLLFY
jgi:hypothetical protein